MQLVRIGGEVVKLAPWHVAVDADAPALVDEGAHGQFRRQRRDWPLRAVFDQDAVMACAIVALKRWQQALALDAVVGRKPGAIEERRRDVESAIDRAGA